MGKTGLRSALVALVLLSGAVGGCGSGDSPGRAASSPPVEQVLAQALERGDAGRDETLAYWDRMNAALTRCMKVEGYDYRSFVDQASVDRRVALGLSREQFVQRYGYGLTTLIDYVPPGTRRVNPNEKVLRAMPADQARGWQTRLVRCRHDADRELGPAPGAAAIGMSPEETARTDKIYAAVDGDPRVVRALATRASCLREKGFDSKDSSSLPLSRAAERFTDRFERAVAEAERNGRDSNELRLEDVFSAQELTELKQLQEREIAEARQTEPCQWPYDDLYKQVYKEYLDKALEGGL